jgi:protein disulfide-isomerase
MYARILCLALLLAGSGCHKSQPLPAQHAPHPHEPPDIAWFDGSLEGAFIVAKRESRPVLLYWGAEWCPFCHTLKSKVFSRPDFIAKSHLFLPVYMDGDDDGAQKWAEQFQIQGYPTMIVLDADRHEILRLGAGRDVSQYAAALDLALEDLQPAQVLLDSAADGRALSADECRRLAYDAWELDALPASGFAARARQLQSAARQCPAPLRLEQADLLIYAAYYAADAPAAPATSAGARGVPLSPQLLELSDQLAAILMQRSLAVSSAEALQMLDDGFFEAARARGPKFAATLRDNYVATMEAAAGDARYVEADQLGFIDAKLRALKVLGDPPGRLPKAAVAEADARLRAALAAEQNPYVRSGLVNAALGILEDVGDYPQAYQIAKAEIGRSATPYYYEADLGEVAEKLGHKDEALALLAQSYRDAQGAATRFQWGQRYVSALLRLAPDDTASIARAGVDVLGELDGPDRIYRRVRVRLESLDHELRAWNHAASDRHGDVLQTLHQRMQQICGKIPQQDAARASCDAFLDSA